MEDNLNEEIYQDKDENSGKNTKLERETGIPKPDKYNIYIPNNVLPAKRLPYAIKMHKPRVPNDDITDAGVGREGFIGSKISNTILTIPIRLIQQKEIASLDSIQEKMKDLRSQTYYQKYFENKNLMDSVQSKDSSIHYTNNELPIPINVKKVKHLTRLDSNQKSQE